MLNEKYFEEVSGRLTVEGYKEIYEAIVALSCDADGYGLFKHITDEDVEKCKWIAAIYEVLNDVPHSRMVHIFKQKKIKFDCDCFIDTQCH